MRQIPLTARVVLLAALVSVPAWAEEKLYYVAVDTAAQSDVERALQDLQSRYGIKYGPLGAPALAPSQATVAAAAITPLVLKVDRKTRASGRIPKNDRELQELTAAARESPAACYAWIYGKDSPPVQQLQGRTWSALGDDDGVQQCRAESSRVRAAKSLFGF